MEKNFPDSGIVCAKAWDTHKHCGTCKSRLSELCRSDGGMARGEAGELGRKQAKKKCFILPS